MSLVFLVGFMASGKTSVGAELADRLGRPFFDLDQIIEREQKLTVAEIFASKGESAFRSMERAALKALLQKTDGVIATGGGSAANADLMDCMRAAGLVFHLDVSEATALARIQGDATRPLATGKKVGALYHQRAPHYQRAHAAIAVDQMRVSDIAQKLSSCVLRCEQESGTAYCEERVLVQLGQDSYPVFCKAGGLEDVGQAIRAMLPSVNTVGLLTDANVDRLYAETLTKCLSVVGLEVVKQVILPGESEKNVERFGQLCETFIKAGLDRGSAIVTLGGGVVGDLGGFVAASLFRGIEAVQVPTSLLAMVDSSVGGKTGINSASGKNLMGAFWQPRFVMVDPNVLGTLPKRELRSGLGEVIKTALLDSEDFFDSLERDLLSSTDLSLLPNSHIQRCIAYKADVVSRDVREQGLRYLLNLGHTLGHAIEVASGFGTMSHGEAVALGLLASCRVSEALGLMGNKLELRLKNILMHMDMGFDLEKWMTPEVLSYVKNDKKRRGESIHFIGLRGVGRPAKLELSLTNLETILLSSK